MIMALLLFLSICQGQQGPAKTSYEFSFCALSSFFLSTLYTQSGDLSRLTRLTSCENFPGKQHNFWHNLRRTTRFNTVKPLAMRRWTTAPPLSNVTFCPIWCLWINLKGLNKCLLTKKTFCSARHIDPRAALIRMFRERSPTLE